MVVHDKFAVGRGNGVWPLGGAQLFIACTLDSSRETNYYSSVCKVISFIKLL